MSEVENKAEGEVSKLSGEGQQNTTNPSDSSVHQEGIDHIKANTDAGEGQAPSSNPATDDSMPSGSGGDSGTTSSETAGDTKVTEDDPTDIASKGSSSQKYESGSSAPELKDEGNTGITSSDTPGDTKVTEDDPTDMASKGSSSQKYENTSGATETTEETGKESGGHEEHNTTPAGKQQSGTKENPSAIPTAGGQQLGAAHAGESKMVPDVPKTQEEETQKVSSAEGQPDSQTKDNTSANVGGAAAPPSSSKGSGEGEGKQKLTDKIKDKLHMG